MLAHAQAVPSGGFLQGSHATFVPSKSNQLKDLHRPPLGVVYASSILTDNSERTEWAPITSLILAGPHSEDLPISSASAVALIVKNSGVMKLSAASALTH